MGQRKSGAKREVTVVCLPQETSKFSNSLTLYLEKIETVKQNSKLEKEKK